MKSDVLLFDRPEHLQATVPPETRATPRDGVRLLVTTHEGNVHARFNDLHEFLEPGDLLVVNESATIPASLPAEGSVGRFVLNLSTNYGDGLWLAEPRWGSSKPGPLPLKEGELVWMSSLIGRLVSQYPGLERLWFVQIHGDVEAVLAERGSPIRYGYVDQDYPLEAYQTVFARVPGSAEMPSAGCPFSQDVIDSLREKGVRIASVVLHTGVSSLEVDSEEIEDQVMYPEPYVVPPAATKAVNDAKREGRRVIAVGTTVVRALESNDAKREGRRVIAVGTTVVRALESAWDGRRVRPGSGFTRLYIHPGGGVHVVDGLLTGFHDPMASHLAMLYALAGEEMVRGAYTEAVQHGYLWHEFGDINLILPRRERAG